jgi:hypothetical protein
MIRFHIKLGDDTLTTNWQEEPVTHGTGPQTAVVKMTRLRQQYSDAKISIERNTVIPKPETAGQVRYKIQLGQATYYSKVVDESEADALLAELKEKFSDKAVISRG